MSKKQYRTVKDAVEGLIANMVNGRITPYASIAHFTTSQRACIAVELLPTIRSLSGTRRGVKGKFFALTDLGKPPKIKHLKRVYFARSGDRVKIGVSVDPGGRVNALGLGDPNIQFLGSIPGSHPMERKLQKALSGYAIDREWFHWCETVTDVVHRYLAVDWETVSDELLKTVIDNI